MLFKKKVKQSDVVRNRPLLESQSKKVFSYYTSRDSSNDMRRQRYKTEEDRKSAVSRTNLKYLLKNNKLLVVLALPILAGMLVYNSFLQTSADVVVSGNVEQTMLLHEESVYEAAANKAIKESVFNRSKLTVNSSKIEQTMIESFPEIADVQLKLPMIGGVPEVLIIPATPIATVVTANSNSYMIDKYGRLISAKVNKAPKGLPIITDQSGIEAKLGEKILPTDDVSFIKTIIFQLNAKDMNIQSINLPATGRQVDVRIQGKPYYIKFSLANNVQRQTGAFLAIYQKLENDKVTPKEYIDVRVGDRVYYK